MSCFRWFVVLLLFTPLVRAEDDTQHVVVTATRIETPAGQVGSSVSKIDAADIERRQNQFVGDALRLTPGVDVVRSGGPGTLTNVFIRGAESDHTLLLVDGIKFHDPAAVGGLPVFDHLLVGNVGSIEVLRGPQSTLYGAEAIGGVVAVETQRGEGPPTFSFMFEGGSYRTFIERFTAGGGDDKFNYFIAYSRFGSRSFSAHDNNTTVFPPVTPEFEKDPYRSNLVSGRFGVGFSDVFDVDFVVHYIGSDIELDNLGADINRDETRSEQIALKIEPRLLLFDGVWEQKLAISMNQVDRHNRGVSTAFVFLPTDFFGRITEVDWQNNMYIDDTTTLVFGLDYEHQKAEFDTPTVTTIRKHSDSLGFYLQLQKSFADRLFLTAGFRVDDHEDFGTETTYRFTGAYHLRGTETILRASAGTAFKAPSLADLFDTTTFVNNTELDAEKSFGFDVGVEQKLFDGNAIIGTTFFYNEIQDMIFFFEPPPDPPFTGTVANAGDVRINGVETFLFVQVCDNVQVRLNYTFLDTEIIEPQGTFGPDDDDRVLRRPMHNVGAEVVVGILQGKGELTFGLRHSSERDDTSTAGRSEAYTTVNINASVQIADNVELFARVENVLNEQYQEINRFNSPDASAFAGFRITFP